jgi:hypothetical protein
MTRTEMKALPLPRLTSSYARTGDLVVLSFAVHDRHMSSLYEKFCEVKRYWRAVQEEPAKAIVAQQQMRAIWSRLVDLSRGYWLHGLPLQEYTPDA